MKRPRSKTIKKNITTDEEQLQDEYNTEENKKGNGNIFEIQNIIKKIVESDNNMENIQEPNEKVVRDINRNYPTVIFQSIVYNLTSLNNYEKDVLLEILNRSYILFSNKPGCAKGYQHKLKLLTEKPSIRHTYPIPIQLREPTNRAINKMMEDGVIERAISQYSNPLRIVKKEDDTVRVCLDARFVNKIIEDDHESPPLINEVLQKFHGAKWFTKLDLTQGY